MTARLALPVKGDNYDWNGIRVLVTRVARDGTWADITAVSNLTVWTKRQPLPFPDSFKRVHP
jgi:hypothetical protein